MAVYAENSGATVEAAAACLGQPLGAVLSLSSPGADAEQLSAPFLGVPAATLTPCTKPLQKGLKARCFFM